MVISSRGGCAWPSSNRTTRISGPAPRSSPDCAASAAASIAAARSGSSRLGNTRTPNAPARRGGTGLMPPLRLVAGEGEPQRLVVGDDGVDGTVQRAAVHLVGQLHQ